MKVTLNPIYNASFSFVLKDSSLKGDILIEALDHDKANSNDSLGFARISLLDVRERGWLAGWFNLFIGDKKDAERNHGRFYVRLCLDSDHSKLDKSALDKHRAGMLEAVRRAEVEAAMNATATLAKAVASKTAGATTESKVDGNASPSTPSPSSASPLNTVPETETVDVATDGTSVPTSPRVSSGSVSAEESKSTSRPRSTSAAGLLMPAFNSLDTYIPLKEGPATNSRAFSYSSYGRPSHLLPPSPDGTGHVVRILCSSWNVGNAAPPEPAALRHWLEPGADIYAIGTQENQYTARKPYKSHKDDFNATLEQALGSEYMLIDLESMGQIHTHLFIKKALYPLIDVLQIEKGNEATGVANVGTNKGGTFTAISIMGTTFIFVSSHLAAHTTQVDRRNSDVAEIVRGLVIKGNHHVDVLHSGHHIFWMGDLNYRLEYAGDKDHPDETKFAEMLDLIKQGKYDVLLATDQLHNSMLNNEVFIDFEDAPINFRPTFKVEREKEYPEYNTKRSPSYCDRVLWRSADVVKGNARCVSFKSAEKVTTSDHKPVAALFEVIVKPLAPAVDDSKAMATLVLGDIDCKDLPIGDINTSDPFIRFVCSEMNKGAPICTSHKKNTLSPHWDAAELPTLPLDVNNLERMKQMLVPFQVYDKDNLTSSFLCSGEIPMNKVCH